MVEILLPGVIFKLLLTLCAHDFRHDFMGTSDRIHAGIYKGTRAVGGGDKSGDVPKYTINNDITIMAVYLHDILYLKNLKKVQNKSRKDKNIWVKLAMDKTDIEFNQKLDILSLFINSAKSKAKSMAKSKAKSMAKSKAKSMAKSKAKSMAKSKAKSMAKSKAKRARMYGEDDYSDRITKYRKILGDTSNGKSKGKRSRTYGEDYYSDRITKYRKILGTTSNGKSKDKSKDKSKGKRSRTYDEDDHSALITKYRKILGGVSDGKSMKSAVAKYKRVNNTHIKRKRKESSVRTKRKRPKSKRPKSKRPKSNPIMGGTIDDFDSALDMAHKWTPTGHDPAPLMYDDTDIIPIGGLDTYEKLEDYHQNQILLEYIEYLKQNEDPTTEDKEYIDLIETVVEESSNPAPDYEEPEPVEPEPVEPEPVEPEPVEPEQPVRRQTRSTGNSASGAPRPFYGSLVEDVVHIDWTNKYNNYLEENGTSVIDDANRLIAAVHPHLQIKCLSDFTSQVGSDLRLFTSYYKQICSTTKNPRIKFNQYIEWLHTNVDTSIVKPTVFVVSVRGMQIIKEFGKKVSESWFKFIVGDTPRAKSPTVTPPSSPIVSTDRTVEGRLLANMLHATGMAKTTDAVVFKLFTKYFTNTQR
jgi:hypothetical protein